MTKRSSKVRVLSLILLAVLLLGTGILYFAYAPYLKKDDRGSTAFERPEKVCNVYNIVENDVLGELLNTYTVKRGDTLISIANKVLNNPDAVSDLLSINRNRYPLLEKGGIEVGWKLYLPNDELKRQNYTSIWKASGNLSLIGANKFAVKSQTDYLVGAQDISANIRNALVNIKDGDCIVVYFGLGSGWNSDAYLIKHQ